MKLNEELEKFAQEKESWLKEAEHFKEGELLKLQSELDNLN